MSSYKIYLTKSSEVARLLAQVRSGELKTEDIISISTGAVGNDERIPAIYHGKGYYFCVVELKSGNYPSDLDYELIIC